MASALDLTDVFFIDGPVCLLHECTDCSGTGISRRNGEHCYGCDGAREVVNQDLLHLFSVLLVLAQCAEVQAYGDARQAAERAVTAQFLYSQANRYNAADCDYGIVCALRQHGDAIRCGVHVGAVVMEKSDG